MLFICSFVIVYEEPLRSLVLEKGVMLGVTLTAIMILNATDCIHIRRYA